MEVYGKIIMIATPFFFGLVLLEKWYGWYRGNDTVRNMDTVSSLSSGITNVVKDVLGLTFVVLTYQFLVDHLTIYKVQTTVLTYLIAFVSLDFSGYWLHRWQHKINFFWNRHAIHHSSEEFNLACALRQSVSGFVHIFSFLLLPAALLGVSSSVIAVVIPLHLFAQFWYHTQHIHKMGFLENIIVTPSHHRVHHAINPVYMDKNYGQIFIFWDKWFGSFQPELKEVPPVYGITRAVQTWNPIKINFQHLLFLINDAWRTENFSDKFRIWFMPTGWRPADVAAKFPSHKIEDVYGYKKYDTDNSKQMKIWIWIQFAITTFFTLYLFGNIGRIGIPNVFYYGLFIFLSVYAFTELMDLNPNAFAWELVKNCLGAFFISFYGSWFGIEKIIPAGTILIPAYFIVSTLVSAHFVRNEILTARERKNIVN